MVRQSSMPWACRRKNCPGLRNRTSVSTPTIISDSIRIAWSAGLNSTWTVDPPINVLYKERAVDPSTRRPHDFAAEKYDLSLVQQGCTGRGALLRGDLSE